MTPFLVQLVAITWLESKKWISKKSPISATKGKEDLSSNTSLKIFLLELLLKRKHNRKRARNISWIYWYKLEMLSFMTVQINFMVQKDSVWETTNILVHWRNHNHYKLTFAFDQEQCLKSSGESFWIEWKIHEATIPYHNNYLQGCERWESCNNSTVNNDELSDCCGNKNYLNTFTKISLTTQHFFLPPETLTTTGGLLYFK